MEDLLICSATIGIKCFRFLMKMNPWTLQARQKVRTKKREFYFSFSYRQSSGAAERREAK